MGRYVDGFIIPIKKSKLKEYKKMATIGRDAWMKHGALDYYECVADDLKMPYGGLGYDKLCALKSGETLIFAFVVFKSKAHRNQVNKKVHADMAAVYSEDAKMPFDPDRMSMGGFQVLVRG